MNVSSSPVFEWPDDVTDERAERIAIIIWVIATEGPFEDDEGRATSLLVDALRKENIVISGSWLSKTLGDLERGGRFGHFINRRIRGKRTFKIECVRTPGKDPFPPDPRAATRQADLFAVEPEDAEIEVIDDIETEHLDLPAPGVALVPVEENTPSRVDRYLYMVSLLNEMISEELMAPARSFEEQLGERLTAVNAILEENVKLKRQVEKLTDDKKKLAQALEQANAMMRDQAARMASA